MVLIDADLQDPPELIADLVARWEEAMTSFMAAARRGRARLT